MVHGMKKKAKFASTFFSAKDVVFIGMESKDAAARGVKEWEVEQDVVRCVSITSQSRLLTLVAREM